MNLYRFKIVVLYLSCLLAATGLVNAQDAKLSADSMLIGDQIQLRLRVPTDAGKQIVFPEFQDTLISGIEVIRSEAADTTDKKFLTKNYLITSFEDSLFIIPPIAILADADTLYTQYMQLKVSYYQPDSLFMSRIDTSQIVPLAGLKPPINTPMTFAEFKNRFGNLILIILAGLLLTALGIYIYIRRKQNKPIFAPSKPKIPAHIKALDALSEIKSAGVPEGERLRKYYDRLSYVLRVYLEERFGIPAPDYISHQITEALKQQNETDENLQNEMADFLQTADMVKFAKFRPEIYETEKYLQFAFDFVQKTKEIPEEEAEKNEKKADDSNPKEN